MNDARQLYLATYGRIDTIDNLIKKCQMYYCCWKYWHSAKNHGLALAVVVAYGMYIECASEPLAMTAFGIDRAEINVLSFHDFRDKASGQGLAYSPLQRQYPGDSAMRAVTRRSATQRRNSPRKAGRPKKTTATASTRSSSRSSDAPIVTPQDLKLATRYRLKSRLCGDLTAFNHHIKEKVNMKHHKVCAYCGEKAYTMCTVCPDQPALHFFPSKGPSAGKTCFLDYHNNVCFGLARQDFTGVLGKRKSEWSPPSERKKQENAKHIKKLEFEEAEAINH